MTEGVDFFTSRELYLFLIFLMQKYRITLVGPFPSSALGNGFFFLPHINEMPWRRIKRNKETVDSDPERDFEGSLKIGRNAGVQS